MQQDRARQQLGQQLGCQSLPGCAQPCAAPPCARPAAWLAGWRRYPGSPERFEQRVEGLLAAFRQLRLPTSITDRFHIMGGECNYLLRVSSGPERRLEFVPDAEWKSPYMMSWQVRLGPRGLGWGAAGGNEEWQQQGPLPISRCAGAALCI